MPVAAAPARTDGVRPRGPARLRPVSPTSWSRRRALLSGVALAAICTAATLFAVAAASSPFTLWTRAEQCYGGPGAAQRSLYPLQSSTDLRGLSSVRIVSIESRAWSGARAPEYWIVPVQPDRLPLGAGVLDTTATWTDRVPATGGALTVGTPATLVVELFPRNGHALLTALQVTYRTPDGLLHTELDTTRMQLDATGRCLGQSTT